VRPDLQRRVHRLAHLQRVGPELPAEIDAERVDLLARLAHRDDRERQAERAHEDAAHLPVAEVAGDEDHAASEPELLEEDVLVQAGPVEERQRARRRELDAAEEVGGVGGVAAERPQRQRPHRTHVELRERAAEVAGERGARLTHQGVRDPRTAVGAGVAEASRARVDQAVHRVEEQPGIERVSGPGGQRGVRDGAGRSRLQRHLPPASIGLGRQKRTAGPQRPAARDPEAS
jgi:hypothetical protein